MKHVPKLQHIFLTISYVNTWQHQSHKLHTNTVATFCYKNHPDLTVRRKVMNHYHQVHQSGNMNLSEVNYKNGYYLNFYPPTVFPVSAVGKISSRNMYLMCCSITAPNLLNIETLMLQEATFESHEHCQPMLAR